VRGPGRQGLYGKARAGAIPEFTGVSSPYEPPEAPDLVLDTAEADVAGCVARLLGAVAPRIAPAALGG
jgi:adenylylsulfate kinase-like enzyme